MTVTLKKPPAAATPIHAIDRQGLDKLALPETTRRWFAATGFKAAADTHCLVPAADGSVQEVWTGVRSANHPWLLAALPRALPPGRYRLGDAGLALEPQAAAFSWELGSYVFDLYKPPRREAAELVLAPGEPASRGLLLAGVVASVRDLVNTPAEQMGPGHLAQAVAMVGKQYGAKVTQVVGDALLKKNFPAIHAVGRAAHEAGDAASERAPRLVELTWGDPQHPLLSLVGKGVCFDSGGLDLKTADGMRLMKKDMGGAAHALGLAQMIMALQLPVRLQLLIPAVENAVAGNAFRPGDVFKTRSGLHIEIGNTDAEGRVILCDALSYAAEHKPDLIVDLATLTGAARIALGPQLPALFTRSMTHGRELVDLGLALADPLWHLPLWSDYHDRIESDVADIVNTGRGGLAGAVTAALFLADFVPEGTDWLHVDLFAWNDGARPGRPVGGEAQALRTLLAWLERRYR